MAIEGSATFSIPLNPWPQTSGKKERQTKGVEVRSKGRDKMLKMVALLLNGSQVFEMWEHSMEEDNA